MADWSEEVVEALRCIQNPRADFGLRRLGVSRVVEGAKTAQGYRDALARTKLPDVRRLGDR